MGWNTKNDLAFVMLCVAVADGAVSREQQATLHAHLDTFGAKQATQASAARLTGLSGRQLARAFEESCQRLQVRCADRLDRRVTIIRALSSLTATPMHPREALLLRVAAAALQCDSEVRFSPRAPTTLRFRPAHKELR